ncbi:MAG: TolC family protein [Polyangiaceae bacterium]
MIRRAFLVTALTFSVGCASTSPASSFSDTSQLVSARVGRQILWDQAGADDARVAKYVHELLAHDLTSDGAVQVALLNNKGLRATYENLSIAQADLVQAGLLQNPVLGGGIVFPVAGNAQTGGDISITQDFMSVFTLAARKRVAASALEATKLRVGDAVIRLAFDVETAFYNLQSVQQAAAMRREILRAEDAAADLARAQHDAGNINDLDLANQEAAYAEIQADTLRSDAQVATARETLARLLGVWGADANFKVSDKLPELPKADASPEHLESLAIGRRLDLEAVRADAQQVSDALAMAKNFRFLGAPTVGGTFERSPEGFSVAGPNASLEVPIFDQKQAAIARLEGQLRAALARESMLAVDIRSEVREARANLAAERALVERYATSVVPLRQKIVALSQQQYNGMLLGAYQLIQAKQSEVRAYSDFIEALRDYWIASAALERATGGSLTSSGHTMMRGGK